MTSKRAPLPSGHAGVYRAGRKWEAFVMDPELTSLGTYATIKAAVDARTQYWAARTKQSRHSSRAAPIHAR